MLKKLFFLLLLVFNLVCFSQTSSCVNADFELGNFNGWNGQTGTCCPINTSSSLIINGRHTIMSGTGTDPYTCNVVSVVAPGGTFSARLGNSNTGRQAEKLSYRIPIVDVSNALFIYKYAVVFQNPGDHTAADQPRFEIKVLNSSNQIIDPVCGQYAVVSDSNIPGFQTCSTTLSSVPIRYKNWTTVGLDLSPYTGQSITIEFATGDCDLGGHFGYAYIDAFCSPLEISSNFCVNSTSAVLTAPLGFSYLWNTGATTQSISVNNPVIGDTYSCTLTSVTGCIVSISSTLRPVDPTADFTITNTCFDNATFSGNASITPSGTSFSNFLWDFGNGTSISPNPTHVFPGPGSYNVNLTVTNNAGCTNSRNYNVNLVAPPNIIASPLNQTTCTNNPIDIALSSSTPGTTFSWTATQNGVTGAQNGIGNSINQTLVTTSQIPGTADYIIKATSGGCTTLPTTASVTVNPKPINNSLLNLSICSDQNINIPLSSNVVGSTFSWTASSNGASGATNGTGNQISQILQNLGNSNGTVNYSVTPSFNGCDGEPSVFSVIVNPVPKPTLSDGSICVDALGNAYSNYLLNTGLSNFNNTFNWSFNGNQIQNYSQNVYLASAIGTYSVVVTNTINGCQNSPAVSASVTATNPAVSLFAYVDNNLTGSATITVVVNNGTGPFLYQLDNGPFQLSNVFTSVTTGLHNITVSDSNNCTNLKTRTMVIDYPNFFTPNGDSYNDYWNIYGIQSQPFAKIQIFDRYGKFISQINPLGIGWDGNYNGRPLPASDYWFVLEYLEKDDTGVDVWRTFKSHFSLLR
jgi:gliding motility-associated-like protein